MFFVTTIHYTVLTLLSSTEKWEKCLWTVFNTLQKSLCTVHWELRVHCPPETKSLDSQSKNHREGAWSTELVGISSHLSFNMSITGHTFVSLPSPLSLPWECPWASTLLSQCCELCLVHAQLVLTNWQSSYSHSFTHSILHIHSASLPFYTFSNNIMKV